MTTDPMVSSRLHVVDEAWPIDEDEQFRRFQAGHRYRDRRGQTSHLPGGTNRVVTVAVAFTVFLLGGVFAWQAFRPASGPTPVGTVSEPAPIDASISTFDTGLRFLEGAVVADGSVWVAGSNGDSERGQLVRMDPTTGEVIARIDVPVPGWEFGGAGITAARGSVWIAAGPTGTDGTVEAGAALYRIDPETNSVADAVRIGDQSPADVWVDDTGIWVLTNAGADRMTVSRIDPDTYSVLASVQLATTWSQTIAHAGGHVWVFGSTQGDAPAETLFELDPETLALTDELQPTDGSAFFLTTSGDRIWFNHQGLRALDASTGEQAVGSLAPINECCAALTGDGTGGVWVLDPSGSRPGLWHSDAGGEVDRFDDSSFGGNVDGQASAFDPDTDTLWVVHYDGTITRVVIEAASNDEAVQVSPPPPANAFFLAPYLAGGQGWNSMSSDPVPARGQNATVAWASTIPISEHDVMLRAAIPPMTISELPPDGIVVTVLVVPSSYDDTTVPFPYADRSFDLSMATERGPEAEEPAGNYSVLQIDDPEAATLVRVYFGTANVTSPLLDMAQAELDTLQLPPTCTVGGPGSFAVSASVTEGSPGDTITLSGRVPFQHEDGSFDEAGNGRLVAWWNANPGDWPYLASDPSSVTPAVQGEGGLIELGSSSMDSCAFEIPFAVPGVTPGDYPVVVVQQGAEGATLEGSLVIHVR
jgi:hypothetical protein